MEALDQGLSDKEGLPLTTTQRERTTSDSIMAATLTTAAPKKSDPNDPLSQYKNQARKDYLEALKILYGPDYHPEVAKGA